MTNSEIEPICRVKAASVHFSPSAPVFVAAYESANAKLFDSETGEELFRFTGARQICGVVFLPDQERVVLAEQYHSVGIYSLSNGKRIGKKWTTRKKGDELDAFLHAIESQQIIHAGGHGALSVLDYDCQLVRHVRISEHKPQNTLISRAALSPDESRLAVGWATCYPLEIKNCLTVFEWPLMKLLCNLDHFMQRPDAPHLLRQLEFLNNTELIVAEDEAANVFDTLTGDELPAFPDLKSAHTFYVHVRSASDIEFVTNVDGKLVFRDATTSQVRREIDIGCDWIVSSISLDERRIALMSRTGNNVCDFAELKASID
jgi:hypothetical protein